MVLCPPDNPTELDEIFTEFLADITSSTSSAHAGRAVSSMESFFNHLNAGFGGPEGIAKRFQEIADGMSTKRAWSQYGTFMLQIVKLQLIVQRLKTEENFSHLDLAEKRKVVQLETLRLFTQMPREQRSALFAKLEAIEATGQTPTDSDLTA